MLAKNCNDLGKLLTEYGENTSTPQQILTFFESKLALDTALEKISALPDNMETKSWEAYVNVGFNRINTASKLLLLLESTGKTGETVDEIIIGLSARKESIEMIDTLEKDFTVTEILRENFQGVNTDLKSLSSTLSWGYKVIDNLELQSSTLKHFLLSCEATANFLWLKQRLYHIIELHDKIKSTIIKLEAFGVFSWDNWNCIGREYSKHEQASIINKKLEDAASNIDAVLS